MYIRQNIISLFHELKTSCGLPIIIVIGRYKRKINHFLSIVKLSLFIQIIIDKKYTIPIIVEGIALIPPIAVCIITIATKDEKTFNWCFSETIFSLTIF